MTTTTQPHCAICDETQGLRTVKVDVFWLATGYYEKTVERTLCPACDDTYPYLLRTRHNTLAWDYQTRRFNTAYRINKEAHTMPQTTSNEDHKRNAGQRIAWACEKDANALIQLYVNDLYASVWVNGVFITLDSNTQGARNIYEALCAALQAIPQ